MCRGVEADAEFNRAEVRQDAHWRLTVNLSAEVPGFAQLEPKRHIPYVTDLEGDKARTFGAAVASCSRALLASPPAGE